MLKGGICPLERQAAEDAARLQALREAADVGVADIEAGRFRTFDAPERFAGISQNWPRTPYLTLLVRRRADHEKRAGTGACPYGVSFAYKTTDRMTWKL